MKIAIKIILTLIVLVASFFVGMYSLIVLGLSGTNMVLATMSVFVLPGLLIPIIWCKKRKKAFLIWLVAVIVYSISVAIPYVHKAYEDSLVINTDVNIDVSEYLPFKKDSKIVKVDNASLKLTDNLPIIDGAAAVFPVYSAFVHAVYPETTELEDDCFRYNNTRFGYEALANKEIDIFFGAYPSENQIQVAKDNGVEFEFTPIGYEAFVFFVHKDNKVSDLMTEQVQSIYSGEYINWEQVGGANEKIVAFQRNEGSGSQSMLKRFMGDIPIMKAPTEQVNDLMSGIINEVADYKNKTSSIGFSFRYYLEGIIKNPNIKILSIDGVTPNTKNIKSGAYPIVTPLYAVTYKGNDNENVQKLIDWILSEEGQYIIEETGYVGVN